MDPFKKPNKLKDEILTTDHYMILPIEGKMTFDEDLSGWNTQGVTDMSSKYFKLIVCSISWSPCDII